MSNGDDAMTSAEFAKLMGAYPEPAGNPSPAYGGFMDNSAANFSWVQNNDYFGAESDGDLCDVCETNKLLFEMTDMAANEVLCQSCIQDGHDSHWTIKTHIPETFPVDSEAYKTPKTEVGYTVGNGAESESNSCDTCQKDKPIVAHVEFDGPFLSALCKECYAEHLEMGGKPNVYGAESFSADFTKGYTDATETIQYEDKFGQPKKSIVQSMTGYAGDCPSCSNKINFPIGSSGLYCDDCEVYLLPSKETGLNKTLQYDAESFNAEDSCLWCEEGTKGNYRHEGRPTDYCSPFCYNKGELGMDAESFNADLFHRMSMDMPEEMWSRRHDQLKGERGNVHFDSGKIVRVDDEYYIVIKANQQMGIKNVYYRNRDFKLGPYPYTAKGWNNGYMKWKQVPQRGRDWATEVQEALGDFTDGYRPTSWNKGKGAETEYHGLSAEEYYAELNEFYADMEELTDGVSAIKNRFGDSVGMVQVDDEDLEDVSVEITDTDGGVVYEGILADEVPDMEEEDYYLAEMKKPSLLALALGVGAVLLGGSLLKDKLVKNADNDIQEVLEDDPELIESPNMGDLSPAAYEELVVESTGYAVDVIPMSLDGAFMGSRFAALPTERYVEYNDPGIGAHTDIALTRNENFLEPEMAMVQAAEGENVVKETQAPGQSPYLSMDGQEPKDFSYRVLKETHPVSLDPAVVPFIPQSMAGYTGNDNRPPSVYNKMFNLGVLGQTPLFVPGNNDDIGSSHTGSRRATPSKMGNIGGPLSDAVNASYTDGQTSKSLAQWSIENKVQQTSDTEAMVIDRSSGNTKRIRRV